MSEPVKDPEFFQGCPGKDKAFTKLLYGLCFFHAVVQERRNYGSQGWNIRYGFNESDFLISLQQLQIFINEYDNVPFEAITYLTGECNYGGRVTDDRDRRCLNTILQDFYNTNVISDPNYTFGTVAPEYTLPKKCEHHNYVKQIEGIPTTPPPEVFGLHMNAGISRDLQVSKTFFDSMLCIRGTVFTGDTTKQDQLLLTMKKDIYERMPELFNLEDAQKIYPVSYMESMNTVLIQEMERYNTLLNLIRNSMVMLEKAVQGMIVMTPELEVLASSMLIGKIPTTWLKASAYPSLKPLPSFVNDFIARLKFLQSWLDNGKPVSFWISGFSFIHAFLTGATQNYARKYKVSIDKIDFDFEVINKFESSTAPDDGVYIYGMHLVGARWDLNRRVLAESYPKVLSDPMPIVWLKPCETTRIEIGKRYECPLYITSLRFGTLKTTGHSTNYVLSFLIDTDMPVSHWIKRGLALLCQLDD